MSSNTLFFVLTTRLPHIRDVGMTLTALESLLDTSKGVWKKRKGRRRSVRQEETVPESLEATSSY
jgi:hypothetical protein